jgi:amino acid transporter
MHPSAEDKAERRRMSFSDLFFLAAGGVIGSGWFLSAVHSVKATGRLAVFSWIIGGALVLVIATVMVELSTVVPKTGGLTFLPLQSSGPLFATIVAAGVWIFYAVSPTSAAVGMVNGLADWHVQGLVKNLELTPRGLGLAALFLLGTAAVTMLGPRLFLILNNVLTGFKILIPLLIVGLFFYAHLHPPPASAFKVLHSGRPTTAHFDVGTMLAAVTGTGVIFTYLGFQGPLDFAGNVRRRGVGEALRLRWAVYGTVCGSILLYVSLQFVVFYVYQRSGHAISGTQSPYPEFASVVAPAWAAPSVSWLISLDTVLSPAGTGMVFTYVLTREVAALSRAHLTHRGLQQSKYSVIPLASRRLRKLFGDDRLDVYWLILIVDLLVSAIALLCFSGDWFVLSTLTTVLALIVYSTQSVVLASLRRREPGRFPRAWHSALAEVAFVSIAVIFFMAGWDDGSELWQGMAALTVGCLLLFGLPLVLKSSRWYDAAAHAIWLRRAWTNPAARSAVLLFSFYAALALASLVVKQVWPAHATVEWYVAGLAVIAVLSWVTFRQLVALSVSHMEQHKPTLPEAMPMARHAAPAPSRGERY